MSALFPLINHLIQQNPEQQRELSEFAGSIICISLTGFRLTGRISEQGFLETANETADTNITFHNSAIQKILQGGQPGVGDISLEGDLVLGMSVLPIWVDCAIIRAKIWRVYSVMWPQKASARAPATSAAP